MNKLWEEKFRAKLSAFTVISFLFLSFFIIYLSWRGYSEQSKYYITTFYFLYNLLIALTFISLNFSAGIIITIFACLLGLFFAPISRSLFYYLPLSSFLITGSFSYILLKRKERFWQKNRIGKEELEAERNLLQEEETQMQTEKEGWKKKLLNYSILREITESLSSTLSQDEIFNLVTDSALYLIGKGETALLFIVEDGSLSLRASSYLGESSEQLSKVKSKSGDAFDTWVLKRNQNLIVTDGEKDFRFRTSSEDKEQRKVSSIISSPIFRSGELKGILRLDSSSPDVYAADSLRLLDIVAGLASLAIENAELYEKTEELAIKDNLTGLYVHRYFQACLGEEIHNAEEQNYPLNLLMLDLDNFKDYNDNFGHIAGDITLRHLAKILIMETKPGDIVARYGGEEFCILMPRISKEEAYQRAEAICSKVSEHTIVLRRNKTKITVSIGVASFPQDAPKGESLIQKADEALYRAKEKGKNQVCQ